MPTVTLSNGKQFDVAGSMSILDAAMSQGVTLDYSCRTGRCGTCKAPVTAGETVVLRAEESLTPEESLAGTILTCCRGASGDLALDIEDLGKLGGIAIRTMPCKIADLVRLTPDIVKVVLRTPPASRLTYLAGQYVDVIARGVRRSYSIANAPRADGSIELLVKRYPGGVLSGYWFDEARPGDLLRLEGPLGTFFLRDDTVADLVFLATGTGIAPVKAMLEELESAGGPRQGSRIAVYWGNRHPEDFCWQGDFKHLDPGIHRLLSGPAVASGHRRGYVQHAAIADAIDLSATAIYACGSNAMILAARAQFAAAGLPSRRFLSDAFVSSS